MQQSHTYRIRKSQRTDQKCGKSVPAPTQEEFQNFSSPALRKKLKPRLLFFRPLLGDLFIF